MLEALEKKIFYIFKDPALLERALTHASVQCISCDNERLEFVGDRVLGLVIADLLYTHFAEEDEGSLAKRHTGLVQQATLVKVATQLDMSSYLNLSPSEKKSGGQKKGAILADAVEALIGAIYYDGSFAAAGNFVKKFWGEMISCQETPPEDAKSKLQEWVQAKSLPLPEYKIIKKSGTDHSPKFEIEVVVESVGKASATAASKRAAEKLAALKLLKKIGVDV